MTNKILIKHLKRLNACNEALKWLGDRDLTACWKECPRGDWMLWLAGRANVDRKLLVTAACECAKLALPIYEAEYPNDKRPHDAIKIALKWVIGKATIEEVRYAAIAALPI